MKEGPESKNSRRVARTLGLLMFGVMSLVSLVVFHTEDHLTAVDYFLVLVAPFILGALGYFVGLYHEPGASD